jgi:hypothetical protein
MEKLKRQAGYYWVYYDKKWRIAEYHNLSDFWNIAGIGKILSDKDMEIIYKYRLIPPQREA